MDPEVEILERPEPKVVEEPPQDETVPPEEETTEEETTEGETPADNPATPPEEETPEEEVVLKPVEDSFVETDDSVLPTSDEERVDWDGNEVQYNAISWSEQEAFTIGNTVVTKGDVAKVSGLTIALIVISSLICLYVSWRKRKRIAQEARRASEFIRRSTRKIRMSIKKLAGQNVDDIPYTQPDANALGKNRHQKEFLKDLFSH